MKLEKVMNREEIIDGYVNAAIVLNQEHMNSFAAEASDWEFNSLRSLMEEVIKVLASRVDEVESAKKEEFADLLKSLRGQVQMLKFAEELDSNSSVEDTKDESKVEEVTQDVAADDSADEAETPVVETDVSQGESDGTAATEEVQEQKSEA